MRPFLPFATLLGVAFLLGCQEQGSEPVGPEGLGPEFHHKDDHSKGGGGGGGKVEATIVSVTVAGGMIAARDMELRVKKDILRLAARPQVEGWAINMTKTHDATIAACDQTGSGAPNDVLAATLFAKLTEHVIDPTHDVFVLIDTRVLGGSSEDHKIVIFGDGIKVQDAPMVTAGDITGNFTATFSGGKIELTGIPTGGNFGAHIHLTCPIHSDDFITFTVVRQ